MGKIALRLHGHGCRWRRNFSLSNDIIAVLAEASNLEACAPSS